MQERSVEEGASLPKITKFSIRLIGTVVVFNIILFQQKAVSNDIATKPVFFKYFDD
jgi:hypothetical protein